MFLNSVGYPLSFEKKGLGSFTERIPIKSGGEIMVNQIKSLNIMLFPLLVALTFGLALPRSLQAEETTKEIDRDVTIALDKLYEREPGAKALGAKAKGILVFPSIVKGGLIIGGAYGTGALRVGGQTVGYYNTVSASYGLQIGAQKFGYAMFIMTDEALKYLENSNGWEIGVGPTVTVADAGFSSSFSTTTAKSSIYAFFFDQKGLMAGVGLQGTKITKSKK